MYKSIVIVLFLVISCIFLCAQYKINDIQYEEIFENNRLITNAAIDYKRDIKVLSGTGDKKWLQNHTDGYKLALPLGAIFDFTMSPFIVKANNHNMDIVITREWSLDEEIREFAKGAKQFGHTFLFRLNNEMNTDWTSYSGVVNLCDPDIYINNWRRVYKIFKEEGVNNAIWIFNPHDRSYPPCNWNHFMAYYPGNEYVHMLGLTGYNNGTYYEDVTGERWREFKEIYDNMYKEYMPLFSKFPWIITEFALALLEAIRQSGFKTEI